MALALSQVRGVFAVHVALGLSIFLTIFLFGKSIVQMHAAVLTTKVPSLEPRWVGAAGRVDPGENAAADDGLPAWKLPSEQQGKMVAVFPVGSTTPVTEAWVRGTRRWRRGIPAIVGSFDEPNPENALDAMLHNETWVTWTMRSGVSYSGRPFMNLVVMTLALAADRLNAAGGFDWVLFGDDDTVFNLDVLTDMVAQFDPKKPHMLTDHLWFRYNGTSYEHGSQAAPRCVPCGVEAPEVSSFPGWRPPQACPTCTWDLLREKDPARPAIYNERGFNPVYMPKYELIAHGGAGMLLSRGLIAKLGSTYLHDCITTKFVGIRIPGGDTLLSHCIFMLNVAPIDPGSLATTGVQAFSPNECQALCAIEDSFRYSKGFDCCDNACKQRLRVTASTHLRSAHFASRIHAMEAMRTVTRARDAYLLASKLDNTERAVHMKGNWDRDRVCL